MVAVRSQQGCSGTCISESTSFSISKPRLLLSRIVSDFEQGRACGVSRAVIAVSLTSNEASDLNSKIRALRDKVERLAM
jgi:hypothetical protein